MIYQAHSHFLVSGSDVEFAKGQLAAAVPWSLLYDGSDDETDCGNNASIMGLHAADMTIDAYFRAGAMANFTIYALATQGPYGGGAGWALMIRTRGAGVLWGEFVANLVTGAVIATTGDTAWVAGNWYYFRGRFVHGVNDIAYCSINAGVEASGNRATAAAAPSLEHLWHGRNGGATHYHAKGQLCYVHIWNVNKGALGAVPTTPFAIDANTVGRWIHSEGAGAVLGDTSGNGNNGAIAGAAWNAAVPAGWHL